MKSQVKTPLIIVLALCAVALMVFMGKKAFTAGDLDQAQGNYTPGVPPWLEKDPARKAVGAHGPGVAAAPSNEPTATVDAQHAPAGMGAPNIGAK
jgi:hypothetical protein